MASTESSRSSTSGSPDSYIGSLISLTSKSEIRYEGVLFNINTEKSSISLRNVSDIKDLQVKSSPSVQTSAPIHNDPAIIQLVRPTFQSILPLYQPGASLGPWGSLTAPTTNGGLSMPIYWQGYYGSTNGLPPQQQPLLRPPPGLSMPPSMQQSMQYVAMNVSLPAAASNLPASQFFENKLTLAPDISTFIRARAAAYPIFVMIERNTISKISSKTGSPKTLNRSR
ncbi:protein decapping 5-like [Durio zibethinus]|uniref:Protein decapping 5-like n=1 Tax=Durio zibethinus TaxID=66656 RepID=A0A6P5ZHG2_DURZI|nr:protein decapping 5-like [Durio zibethinus]